MELVIMGFSFLGILPVQSGNHGQDGWSATPDSQFPNYEYRSTRTRAVMAWASILSASHCRSVTSPISLLAAGVIF
jgi:hypothetical protein